ncbi:TadE/TadG family type IV pilus assembly protein [Gemmata sp. JC717]|uniref:TadE/TadG family type IV pilus assembly protein n=1 Tax=Gemmata algarum TaxID=2975278 RepID=UPI0021BAB348|nr:TadE/TadG family type IV pilus assembly protein [Gemmata algarum]MDY3554905.1 TadE/TadG family type IV pilus assembly protein [Gemmata algarum]
MALATTTVRGRPRGAAAVELALVLPLLALVFAAGVDFARVFRATQVLQSAASSASAYATGTAWAPASTTPTADAARAAALTEGAALDPPLQAPQVTVATAGNLTTVTVVYDMPLFTGFLLPQGTVRLERTATARVTPRPGD